jgi:hypothetical protein
MSPKTRKGKDDYWLFFITKQVSGNSNPENESEIKRTQNKNHDKII